LAKPKPNRRHGVRTRTARRIKTTAIWIGALAAIGGIFYLLANTSGVAYGERQLAVIDFTSLNETQKEAALTEANAERCTCGCGMTLAQCVATDMTCPVRENNITRIRGLVQKALNSGGGS
jgi:hypothetical protein